MKSKIKEVLETVWLWLFVIIPSAGLIIILVYMHFYKPKIKDSEVEKKFMEAVQNAQNNK